MLFRTQAFLLRLLMVAAARAQAQMPLPAAPPEQPVGRVALPSVVGMAAACASLLFSKEKNKRKALATRRNSLLEPLVFVLTVPRILDGRQ